VTEQLSLWSLIAGATLPVQLVMLILFAASVISWVMIVQRGLFIRYMRRCFRQFENTFWSGIDLNELFRDGNTRLNKHNSVDGVESLFRAGFREFNRLTQGGTADPDAVMEGVERAMRVALSREEEKLNAHLPFLASVASVSPYIGLFGTVWGIMHAFIGIAESQNTSLAVVAPGIAEALLATALGLVAAIPAVIFYNKLNADMDRIVGGYEAFADEFSTILSRQLDA